MTAEQRAAELLPCGCGMENNGKLVDFHMDYCSAYYRPQVAGALAEKDAENEYYKKLALEADARDDARLAAAKIEGLCEAREKLGKVIEAALFMYDDKAYYGDNLDRWATWAALELAHIDAEIAVLERGKGE